MRRLVKWFKIRFLFSDRALMDTIDFFNRVDRDLLNDEKLWEEVQFNRALIARELERRGW